MRSIPHATRRENTNLRGKQTQIAACGCCTWRNFRGQETLRLAIREMREAKPSTSMTESYQ